MEEYWNNSRVVNFTNWYLRLIGVQQSKEIKDTDVVLSYQMGVNPSLKREKPTTESILNYICDYFGVTPEILRGKSRNRDHVYPRQIVVYLLRKYKNFSLDKAGRVVLKGHATAYYSVKQIESLIEIDRSVKKEVEDIRIRLNLFYKY